MNCVYLLLSVAGMALGPGILDDYRIPDTRASALTVAFSPSTYHYSDSSERYGASLGLEPAWFFGVNSEKLYLDWRVVASAYTSPLFRDFADTGVPRNSTFQSAYTLLADLYPSRIPVGLNVRSAFNGRLSFIDAQEHSERSAGLSGLGLAGPVLGRVRDATPVITAIRVAEILSAEGQLASPLTEAEIRSLADLIAQRWSYAARHDAGRGEKYFYQSLERFLGPLSRDGKGLSAYTWFHVRDEIERAGSSGSLGYPVRPVGIRLALAGGAGVYRNREMTIQQAETSTVTEARQYPIVRADLDGGWPLSLRLHLSGKVNWQSTFYSYGTQHGLSAEATLSYLAGELFELGATCEPWYETTVDASTGSRYHEYGARVELSGTWYVEDRFTVRALAGLESEIRLEHGLATSRDLSTRFDVSFNYRIR